MTTTEQTYRIEIRFDVTGTEEYAKVVARTAVNTLPTPATNAEITEILDENWNEV